MAWRVGESSSVEISEGGGIFGGNRSWIWVTWSEKVAFKGTAGTAY